MLITLLSCSYYQKELACNIMASTRLAILVFLFLLRRGTRAYTRFETTCTIPPDNPVSFVSSPNTRGTLDILWSCLFTIFACTWTIQHLNIPAQRKSLPPNATAAQRHGYTVKHTLVGVWTNLKWMIITILAPEFILGKAAGDLLRVWRLRDSMRQALAARGIGVEWTLTHGFFALMGGFTARVPSYSLPPDISLVVTQDENPDAAESRSAR